MLPLKTINNNYQVMMCHSEVGLKINKEEKRNVRI